MFELAEEAGSSVHPVSAALSAVRQAISDIEDTQMWGLQSDELAQLVAAHEALEARIASLGLGLVREADRRNLGSSVGATSTADWLRDLLRLDHGVAKGRTDLAALFDVDAGVLDAARRVHDLAAQDGASTGHRVGYPEPLADDAASHARGDATDGDRPTDEPDTEGTVGGERSATTSVDGDRTGLGLDLTAVSELSAVARRYLPCTAWALRNGRISIEHAQVVRRAMKRLPSALDATVWAECEAFLAVQATRHCPRNLARLGSHLATSVIGAHELARQHEREAARQQEDGAAQTGDESSTPATDSDGPGEGEDDFGASGAGGCVLDNDRAEERAEASTMFGFIDNGDGTLRAYGRFSPEAADAITTALAPLAAPRPAADGTPDPRGHATRMGEALVELCRQAMDTGDVLPGSRGARPHVTISATLSTLRREPGCSKAVTMWGMPITPEALRRIACDSEVSRVLTDPAGVPLDVGRQYRTVTPAQWVALVARDKGCSFPGCSRPAAWTQAHHIKHWADGGATDLHNAKLL